MSKDLVKIIDFWQQSSKNLVVREKIDELPISSDEIIDIIGVRRSGKSSLFHLLVERFALSKDTFCIINFEDPFFIQHQSAIIIEEIVETYLEYFSSHLQYLFFDEIQAIPQWEKAIQKLQASGKYTIFVTGSSSKMMSQELSTVLTGRHRSFFLYPFSFREFLYAKNISDFSKKNIILQSKKIEKYFEEYLDIGGFPQVVKNNDMALLKQYFYDILYKDIMFRYQVREKGILEQIAVFLISNSAKLYSLASLQKQFSISHDLAFKYISYLKEAFLVLELPKFSYSLKTQNLSQKKIYAIDTGLAKSIAFRFSEDEGRILENAVFLELLRRGKKLFYHKNKYECDFLVMNNSLIESCIQVCAYITHENRDREISGVVEACLSYHCNTGIILTKNTSEHYIKDGVSIECIPAWEYFLSVPL